MDGFQEVEQRVVPAQIELWVGPAGGLFSTATNWNTNMVPQAGDTLQFGGSVGAVNGTNTNAVDDINGLAINNLAFMPNYNQTITLNQTLTVNGNVGIPTGSTVTIGGTNLLDVPNNTSTFNFGGGTLATGLIFGQVLGGGGTMTINGSDVTISATGGSLINYGTVNWSSANPQQGPGPNINLNGSIDNEKTFNINTASTEKIQGSGSFTNHGTLAKSNSNTTEISAAFTNGLGSNLNLNSGTLNLTGTLNFTNGAITLNGGNLSSPFRILLEKGTLSGNGTIYANVENQGATVTPGVNGVPGTLTIQGNYTQDSGGTLAINIDAVGNYGVLKVQADPNSGLGGTATLGGTLTVNHNANYQPPAGTDLSFMLFARFSGSFATVNISNNQWTDPLGQGLDQFAAYSASPTTYDLVAQLI